MHYYQFNIGDYKSHTEHLSDLEDLAYRRMLDWYYLHETPLPLETSEIARLIRMRTHTDCIAVVLQEFFIRNENGWTNHRADQEIARAGEKSSKASESAKARWSKHKDADAMRTHSESNATHDTLHKTQDTEHKNTKPRKSASIVKPEDVGQTVWDDFLAIRKAKRSPMTQTALEGIQREADKAGWPLETAIQECVARGWQGFKAEWVATKPVDKSSMSFAERDEQARRKRWEEMTGRKWPTDGFAGDTIDAYTLELGHDTSN
jgi:uncharacterized protein YdaU (DUF1376 family)